MPFVEMDHDLRSVGDRTDAAGEPVDDLSAREDALVNYLIGPGIVRPSDGWRVSAAGGSMTVTVGSGSAYADVAVVESGSAQQPPYLVRLREVSVSVQLDASGQQARTDSLWLVVSNQTWDGSGVRLARIGYRPGSTTPDAGWDAALLLATVTVPAGASEVVQNNITDGRVQASVPVALIPQLDAAIVESGEFGVARIPNLPASKTTSGTFADARIPNLNASKTTSGTFADARIPNLNASKTTAGVFALARIPTIPLSNTSETLPVNRGGTGGTSAAAARSNLGVTGIVSGEFTATGSSVFTNVGFAPSMVIVTRRDNSATGNNIVQIIITEPSGGSGVTWSMCADGSTRTHNSSNANLTSTGFRFPAQSGDFQFIAFR